MNVIPRIAPAALALILVGTAHSLAGDKPAALWLGRLLPEKLDYNPGLVSNAFCLNNRGQAAGAASVGTQEKGSDHAFLSADGKMTDLGVLQGYEGGSWARLINSSGQVAGSSSKRDEDTEEDAHAFLCTNGKMTDLGTLGGAYSRACALNSSGAVAGSSATAAGESHAFLYMNGKMRDLGTLGGKSSSACAVNSSGLVAGQSTTASGEQHAFLYGKGKMRDLGTCKEFKYFEVSAMNDSGEIVGVMSANSNMADSHAYYYRDGKFHDLGLPGASSCTVSAVNDDGDIAGDYYSAQDRRTRAFLYHDGKLADLTKLIKDDPRKDCKAIQLNNRGEVLVMEEGAQRNGQKHYLYSKGSLTDLTALIGATKGYSADWVNGLNDAGQVICIGDTPQGRGAFLFNYESRKRRQ